jgi:hypothetical protein
MDRVWGIDIGKENSNILAFGFDEGTVVIKVGSDEPLVSMRYLIYIHIFFGLNKAITLHKIKQRQSSLD